MRAYLLLPLLLVACAGQHATVPPGPQTGILGGEEADTHTAKQVVALVARNANSEYLCTAVLVAPNTLLSAAHCGAEMEQGVAVFSTDLSTATPGERRSITHIEILPRYADTVDRLERRHTRSPNKLKNWGDLAILKFSGRTPAGYRPSEIMDASLLQDGQTVELAGYGLRDVTDQSAVGLLHMVSVSIEKANYSQSEFSVDQTEDKGACHGDSGGPAFVRSKAKLYLVGITSRGTDRLCQTQGIYTKASFYLDWIQQAVKAE